MLFKRNTTNYFIGFTSSGETVVNFSELSSNSCFRVRLIIFALRAIVAANELYKNVSINGHENKY